MKINNSFLFTIVAISLCMSTSIGAQSIEKVWEIKVNDIFPKRKVISSFDQNYLDSISEEFSPLLLEDKLIFGSTDGEIKTVDVNTQEIEHILKVPIRINKAYLFGKHGLIFGGYHKLNEAYYFCSVDLNKKKVLAAFKHTETLLPFSYWAVIEKKKKFYVYDPVKGRSVYTQNEPYSMVKQVFTPDKNRSCFLTGNQEIIDLVLPKFGASIMLSPKSERNDVLEFNLVRKLDKDMVADNINGNTLYYHRKKGSIGQYNVETKEVVWERTYFKSSMDIRGPHVFEDSLFYLVSYPRKEGDTEFVGKLIALNKKTGQSFWLSADLPYRNFSITQFNQSILSVDKLGKLLFLDVADGHVRQSFLVGKGVSKPVVHENQLYVLTKDKLYRFVDKDWKFRLSILSDKIISRFLK